MKKKMPIHFTSKNRRNFFWSFNLAIIFLFVLSNAANAQKAAKTPPDKLLPRKIFTIELTEKKGKKSGKPESDEISFMSDKFTSKLLKEDKFMAAPYTATVDSSDAAAKTITFAAEAKNGDDETVKWEGTVTGEEIEGTAVITNKKGKVKKEYTFSGSLKGKKKKKEE